MSPRGNVAKRDRKRFPRVSGDEPISQIPALRSTCFPRVSGDEPTLLTTNRQILKFSPRERG